MTRYLLICFLMVGFADGTVYAQALPTLRGDIASYYRFADPSDITIEVKVWGAVLNPGLYEVRENISLSTLLSLAGGPRATTLEGGRASTFKVQLYRLRAEGQSQYQLFSETVMDNELVALAQDPILMNGDMLITEERTRRRFGWRDGISILTALASVILVIDNAVLD